MKKFILITILLSISQLLISQTQNPNWITPGQTYLKMYVAADGLYRINKLDFTNAGISTTSIDPRTVKVYYKGNEQPIYFYGEEDGVFNDTDYFDFCGQRNYGGITPAYDVNNNIFYTTDEYNNLYSDTSCYWIAWGGANGQRFIANNYSVTTPYSLDYYYKKIHFEQDTYYTLGEWITDGDYRNFLNDKFQGEGWFWQTLGNNATITQTFRTPFIPSTSRICRFKVFAYPVNYSSTDLNEHRLRVSINNNLIDTIKRDDFNRMDTTIAFPSSFLNQTSNTLTLKYTPPSTFSSAQMDFDMAEIYYTSRFQFDSNSVTFKSEFTDSTSRLFKIKGFISSNELKIYDIVNNQRIANYYYSNDTLFFSGKGNGSFMVYNKTVAQKPLRIKSRSVPNLVTNSAGVDYLIVYNKLFESQVEQLRTYRQTHDGFRAFKAEIEDIYDIFNYGMESPVAVKNFTLQVWNNWQSPKVKYLCLFGRGSLDPKKILTSSTYYQNFVPAYGNPPTDGYFADMRVGSFTYSQDIAVGRLPVIDAIEAQNVVSNIVGYESQELSDWVKNAVFVAGGYDKSDQPGFVSQSMSIINNYISVPPPKLIANKIFLTDTSGFVSFNYQDSIRKTINSGMLVCNYVGHGGNGYWDYSFEDAAVLENGYKMPLFFSNTCFTGKNSESSFRGYCETFIKNNNKGAIGFIGSTGWGFSGSGQTYDEYLNKSISSDSLRRLGDILKKASQRMASDSISSFASRNTINCFNLVGDPASKLLLPSTPEFCIDSRFVKSSKDYPSLGDNIIVNLFPRNFGTNADSCKIRIQLLKNNIIAKSSDTVVKSFYFVDSLAYSFKIDSIANYSLKIILDAENWYSEQNENNNIFVYPITLSNYSILPLKPENNQIIYSDSVLITGLTPQILSGNMTKYLLEIDTTVNFNSSMLHIYFNTNINSIVTNFKIARFSPDTNIMYFWRLNCVVNNDTIGWSSPRIYKFGSFSTNRKTLLNIDTTVTVNKLKPQQYDIGDLQRIKNDSTGFILANFNGILTASSYGGNPWDPSYMLINDTMLVFIWDPKGINGLKIAKVDKTTGVFLEGRHINFTSATSSDSVVNFLNTFDTTQILLMVKLMPIQTTSNLTTAAKNKIMEFGSTKINSLTINSWQLWSFISYSKLPNAIVSEAYGTGNPWEPTNSQMRPEFKSMNGTILNVFGPSQNWKNFNWNQVLFANNSIAYDVYGIDKNNQQVLLFSNIVNNTNFQLDTINSYTYPYLRLMAKLKINNNKSNTPYLGVPSPIHKDLNISYTPPSELVIDYNSIIKSDSIIKAGDSSGISLKYYNVGYKNCYGTVRSLYFYKGAEKVTISQDTNYSTIKIDSSISVKKYFTITNAMYPIRRNNEVVQVFYEIAPLGQQNDYYDFNNRIPINIVLLSNNAVGQFDIFADGLKLQGGEFVKPQPELSIKYNAKEPNTILLSDTTLFRIYINNKYYPLSNVNSNNTKKSNIKISNNSKEKSETDVNRRTAQTLQSVTIYPQLSNGANEIKIQYRTDISFGFDTIKYVVNATNVLGVLDLNNYPNPFKEQTTFLFTLTGAKAYDCKIKIYSVAGRVIKIISAPINVGYNQIQWDGRDGDGDALANGVYFYKLILEGESNFELPVQKLVVLK